MYCVWKQCFTMPSVIPSCFGHSLPIEAQVVFKAAVSAIKLAKLSLIVYASTGITIFQGQTAKDRLQSSHSTHVNKYVLSCRLYSCWNTFRNGAFLMIEHFCKATFNVLYSYINFTFHIENPGCQIFDRLSGNVFTLFYFFLLSKSQWLTVQDKVWVPSSVSLKNHQRCFLGHKRKASSSL